MEATWLVNLVKALEYEEMLVGSLLTVGREKQALLIKNRPLDLAALTAKETQLVDQMTQLEKVRQQLNAKAAEHLGMAEANPTIALLCEKLSPEDGKALSNMRDRLRKAMTSLQAQNQLNAELLKQSIEYVNFNLQMLAKPAAALPSYGRGGRDLSGSAPSRSVMDLRS